MKTSDLKTSHPDAPWMWNEDWVQGRIRCHSGSMTFLLWAVTVIWNGFTWPAMLLVWRDADERAMVKVMMLFCCVGLFLFMGAVHSTLAWFRFGSSYFELAANPGVIGGTLEGRIQTRLKARPKAPIQLTLTCMRRHESPRRRRRFYGRRKHRSSHTNLLWQGGRRVAPEKLLPGPQGLSIPVRLHIPFGLEDTDTSQTTRQTIWNLGAVGDLPGVDFASEFTVPVFRTDDSRPELTQERVDEMADVEGALAQPVDQGKCWVPPVVVRPVMTGGIEYTFRFPATLKTAIGVTLLALVACAGTVLLHIWLEEAGMFALIPAAIAALLLLATAIVWTFKSRVTVNREEINVRKSVLGIPRRWRIAASDVKAVRVKREVVEGVKEEDRDWEIKIERHNGDEVDLGASIPNRVDAVRVAEEIEGVVRVP